LRKAIWTSDLHIFRTAKQEKNQHGLEAALHAAQRADALMDKGDIEGRAVWRCILSHIKDLQTVEGTWN